MTSGGMNMIGPWSVREFATAGALWGVMMLAMMLPVASPSLLALSRAARERGGRERPCASTGAFLLGYAITWLGFSLLAAAAQLALQRAALLSGEGVLTSPALASALLALAGIYQWTPLRDACLTRCRSPMGMFLANWDDGRWGRLKMGARHGAWCVGCCWALMALSFVFGVMNLAWMALAVAFLLIERAIPGGRWLSRGAGALLLGGAIWTFFAGA